MHSRFLTLSLLLPLLLHFHTASATTEAKGALPPPTKLHTDPAELVSLVLNQVHPCAVNLVRTHLEYYTMYTPEKFAAAAAARSDARSKFLEALKLARLPAELVIQLSKPLKERIVRHLRIQWLSLQPSKALGKALYRAGFAEQREGKGAEVVLGPFYALVRA